MCLFPENQIRNALELYWTKNSPVKTTFDLICKKITKHVEPFIPKNTLQVLYNAIVQPYFDYCCPLWDNCGKVLKEKLQKYQSHAARVITDSTFDINIANIFLTLGWEHLDAG